MISFFRSKFSRLSSFFGSMFICFLMFKQTLIHKLNSDCKKGTLGTELEIGLLYSTRYTEYCLY